MIQDKGSNKLKKRKLNRERKKQPEKSKKRKKERKKRKLRGNEDEQDLVSKHYNYKIMSERP